MYVDATGESAAPAVKVIQNLEAEATALGLNVFKDPNGKITGIGEHWTSFTALIKLMLSEEADYRLYSAMTHGHSWATTKLGFSVDTSRSSFPLAVSNAVPITKKLLPAPLLPCAWWLGRISLRLSVIKRSFLAGTGST